MGGRARIKCSFTCGRHCQALLTLAAARPAWGAAQIRGRFFDPVLNK